MIKKTILFSMLLALMLSAVSCKRTKEKVENIEPGFSFTFLTDIHYMPYRSAPEGFSKAIEKVNELEPDFVVTGGDLIMDALGVTYMQADSQYNMYLREIEKFNMPVHNSIGNHEVYGWYERSGADITHPEYGKKMFEQRIAPRFRSETLHGWKFIFLDPVTGNGEGGYMGGIDEEQMQWLREELEATDTTAPIVIVTHIPLLTLASQLFNGATEPNSRGAVVTNAKEVIALFEPYNLKLVLQGHLHYYEVMQVHGTTFITGGAVSGAWWTGPYFGTEEGFLMVDVTGDEFTWDYVDYGWEVPENSPEIPF